MLQDLAAALSGSRFGPAKVTAVQHLSPHMIRITLQGELIEDFPGDCAGGHFKLIVPARDQSPHEYRAFIARGDFKAHMRTYTVRQARPQRGEIDVDVVTHGDLGRVGPWARRARPEDLIVISRCGEPKLVTAGAKRILAAADLTGFPALAAGLETLAEGVQVDAFVEIPSADDRQPLRLPAAGRVRWIVKADPHEPGAELIEAVRAAPAPDAKTSVFVAGEFTTVADLRGYFRKEIGVDKSWLYVSSYWKAGLNEPEHKLVKAAAG